MKCFVMALACVPLGSGVRRPLFNAHRRLLRRGLWRTIRLRDRRLHGHPSWAGILLFRHGNLCCGTFLLHRSRCRQGACRKSRARCNLALHGTRFGLRRYGRRHHWSITAWIWVAQLGTELASRQTTRWSAAVNDKVPRHGVGAVSSGVRRRCTDGGSHSKRIGCAVRVEPLYCRMDRK